MTQGQGCASPGLAQHSPRGGAAPPWSTSRVGPRQGEWRAEGTASSRGAAAPRGPPSHQCLSIYCTGSLTACVFVCECACVVVAIHIVPWGGSYVRFGLSSQLLMWCELHGLGAQRRRCDCGVTRVSTFCDCVSDGEEVPSVLFSKWSKVCCCCFFKLL